MARNETYIAADPERVFGVLADAQSYAHWVVGSRTVRFADEAWPAPGTAFHHKVGKPPIVIKDHTEVLDARPPAMLQLLAHARPLPDQRITLTLRPDGGGTRVTMVEGPANPVLNVLAGPLGHAAIRLRNRESLRRLRALAERGP